MSSACDAGPPTTHRPATLRPGALTQGAGSARPAQRGPASPGFAGAARCKMHIGATSPPITPQWLVIVADTYRLWSDTWLRTSEHAARVARVWIDETLGVQRDAAQAVRRFIEDVEATIAPEAEPSPAAANLARAGDLARSSFFLWTEAGLKALERAARVGGTALGDRRGLGNDRCTSMDI